MNGLAVTYAVLAGVSLTTYVVAARLAGPGTHPVLGTAIVTGIAFVINAGIVLWMKALGAPLTLALSTRSLAMLGVVGVATAAVNLFTLAAYASGLRVTSSFIVGGTSTVLVLLVGFLVLKEPFSWLKLFAVALIAAGTLMLQQLSRS